MLDELVEKIVAADEEDIEHILTATIERKRELYPTWEITYLALPKDHIDERLQTLEFIRKWIDAEIKQIERG